MIERWLKEIEAIGRDARAVLDGLSPEQANQQPGTGRWSVVQNLDHTSRTAGPYLDRIEAGLASADGQPPVRPGLMARLLLRIMEPPVSMRVKTFRYLEPGDRLDPSAVMAEYEATNARLVHALKSATSAHFLRARFNSPYLAPIRIRLDQGVDILLAHARRHLWQARQVRREIGAD
jgi:hypothetical protein